MCFLWFNQIVGSYSIHQCEFPHINIYIKTPSICAISSFRHTLLRLLPALSSAHTLWQFIMKKHSQDAVAAFRMPKTSFNCARKSRTLSLSRRVRARSSSNIFHKHSEEGRKGKERDSEGESYNVCYVYASLNAAK